MIQRGLKTIAWMLVGCLVSLTAWSDAKATDQTSETDVQEKHGEPEDGPGQIDMNGDWKEILDVTFKGKLELSKPLKGIIKRGKPVYSKIN